MSSFTLLRRRKPTSGALQIADTGIVVPSPMPLARQGHVAVLLQQKLIVFGGRGVTLDQRKGPRSYLNDLQILNLTTGRWKTLNSIDINDDNDTRNDSNNDVWPEARHNHAGVALGDDSVLIFGGSGEHGFLDDLWLLNVTDASGEISIRWRRVVKSDPWPAARHGHAWCTVVRDTRTFVVLQGGHSGRQSQGATYHGDLWVFDPQLERFHQVEGPLQQRAQRSWHSMVSLGQHLLLAYGYTFRERSEVYFGDAWLIELELAGDGSWRTHWRLLDVSGDTSVMTARNRVAMCVLADGTSVFVYGGNEFDGRRDEFFDLPSVLTVDAAAGRARAVLLRPSEADAASLKLGHAVAIRVPMSDAVLVCGGERSRQRLDSMLCILIHQ